MSFFKRIKNFFSGTKHISPDMMGIIICEIANTRHKNICHILEEEDLENIPVFVDLYTYAYNFYFIEKTLSTQYKSDVVDKTMYSAFEVFKRMIDGVYNIPQAEELFVNTYKKLNDVMNNVDDPLAMPRSYMYDIGNTDFYNDVTLFPIVNEVILWMDNRYLLSEYKIV